MNSWPHCGRIPRHVAIDRLAIGARPKSAAHIVAPDSTRSPLKRMRSARQPPRRIGAQGGASGLQDLIYRSAGVAHKLYLHPGHTFLHPGHTFGLVSDNHLRSGRAPRLMRDHRDTFAA